jgi:L,D-transpeptidase ErfK/SrfK
MRLANVQSFIVFALISFHVFAATYVLPTQGNLIGEIQYVYPDPGETLQDLGMRFDMGYYEMIRANPHITPGTMLPGNIKVLIPSLFILPSAVRDGLVINLAEYRLYYFPPDENVVITMPVGIGRKRWQTPLGKTSVISKERNPLWHPSAKLKNEAAKYGNILPNEFPAGDHNPLGRYALRLGWSAYLIHGSNRREGIGTQVSAGCVRMLPEDIEYLFSRVAVGTRVRIIYTPVKIGYLENAWYLQVYPILDKGKGLQLDNLVQKQLNHLNIRHKVHEKVIKKVLQQPTGVATKIS